MNKDTIATKLHRVLEPEFNRLKPFLITPLKNGSYKVFDKYTVKKQGLDYVVYRGAYQIDHLFRNKKTAISWCVADNTNKNELSFNIIDLDRRIFNLQQSFQHSQQLKTTAKDFERYMTLLIRNENERIQLDQLLPELDKCIQHAKYIQIRGLANETSRNGQNQSNKTSR